MAYVEHVDVSYCHWKPTDYNVRTGTLKITLPKPLKHTTRGPETLSEALPEGVYCGRQAATETGATQQRHAFSSYTEHVVDQQGWF